MKSHRILMAVLCALLALPAAPLAHADDDAGKIMDLSFEEAPIGKVLHTLARLSGRNVVIAPDVKGQVTIKLQKVHWKDAFEVIAQSTGYEVIHKPGNITIVRRPQGEPRAVKVEAKRRRALEAEAAEASRRKTDLVNEIASSKARIAQLEREIALREAERVKAARDVAATKARVERVERVKRAPATQTLQVHDVSDLVTTHKKAVEKVITKVKKMDGHAQWHGKNVIVRGTPKVHATVSKFLNDVRTEVASKGFVIVDEKGKRRRVKMVDGKVVEATDLVFVEPRTDAKGRFHVAKGEWTRIVEGQKSATARQAEHEARLARARTRISNLQQALEHLKKAGAQAEVERITQQLQVSKDEYATIRAELTRVAEEAARARKAAAARAKRGATGYVRLDQAPGGVEGLRHEVRALRGEVKELTDLVRQLLEMQQDRPLRRR